MVEKKKQASIAAFFSPQAKGSKPASKKPTTPAADAKQTSPAAPTNIAGKDKKSKSADVTASSAKRPRAVSGGSSKAAGETDQQAQTPPPAPAATTPQRPPVSTGSDAAPAASPVLELSDEKSGGGGGQKSIVDLFTTPPPAKRAKPSVEIVSASSPSNDATIEKKDDPPVVPAVTEAMDAVDMDDSDDEFLSGDEDTEGGPHALGPHMLPSSSAAASKPAAKPRVRQTQRKATTEIPVASTAAPVKGKAKPRASPKAKAKADAAAVVTDLVTPATTVTSLKGKKPTVKASVKEKAAAAAAAEPASAEPKQTEAVLDPLVKARIDTYQQKIDELTRQCTHLLQAPRETDGILQEIYGVAIDFSLDLDQNQDALKTAITELFKGLSSQHESQNGSDAVTEFSADIKSFIAKSVQGQSASLSSLSHKLLETLEKSSVGSAESSDADVVVAVDDKVKARVLVMLEMEIKMLAQRTNYGVRPAKANLYEDTSADALWIWEIGNLEKYFVEESQKTIKRVRKNRKRLGLQLKTLARVVQLLHQTPVDEVKVSAEEAKVGKFVLAIESETQKAQDRERKELEKVHAAEQKKQQELDKEHTKLEEKRKREEDEEAEKLLANKRKKLLVSYFRSIDKSPTVVGESSSVAALPSGSISIVSVQATEKEDGSVSLQSEMMARMDEAVGFLVGRGDKVDNSSSLAAETKSAQEVRAHVLATGRHTKPRVTAASGHWSSRRRRDAALGVMKLLQFHENHRPAYYGTFSQKSKVFHGGRRPLAQYKKFDYNVDSEEEWEEEEPGESLSDADSDMDESDDDLDYGDQWLAYEDEVDYIDGADDASKDDGDDDAGQYLSSPERKKKLPAQLEQKKRARVPGRKKAAKPAKLEPQVVGPFLYDETTAATEAADHFSAYTGQLLCQPLFESALMRKAREFEEEKERQRQQAQLKLLEEQEKLRLEQQQAVAEPVVETPSEDAVAKLKTPLKTPQKRKVSAENVALTSPQPTLTAPGSVSTSNTTTPVKAGITAWLKKPAVVDLNNHESDV